MTATRRPVIVVTVAVTLLFATAGGASTGREGGTFRVVEGGLDEHDRSRARQLSAGNPDPRPCLRRARRVPGQAAAGRPPDRSPISPRRLPTISRNRKTYTFQIRKDARFSNGKPVTARDFVHALERILNPAMKSTNVGLFESLVGAQAMLDGTTKKLAGAVARGENPHAEADEAGGGLRDRPCQSVASVPCPSPFPVDPEGAKAPASEPGPYFVAQYVPGERIVLERNRFYKGARPQHVDRFVVELGVDIATAFARVEDGSADYALGPPTYFVENAARLARRHGVNKTQFFVVPAPGVRMFALNASRPLFKANVKLRQAVNFAVDRRALTRELGAYAGTATDQYLPSTMPGHVKRRIYPLTGPDLKKARALANGNRRSGKAVLYTLDSPVDLAQAEILKQNLAAIGIELEIQRFPIALLFQKLATPGEPFDIGRSTGGFVDPRPPRIPVRRADDRPAELRELVVLRLADLQPEARSRVEAPARTGARSRVRTDRRRAVTRCRAGDSVRSTERVHAGLVASRLCRRESVARLHRRLPEVARSVERLDRDPDRVAADGDPGRTVGESDGRHDLVGLRIDPRDGRVVRCSRPRPRPRQRRSRLARRQPESSSSSTTPCRSA